MPGIFSFKIIINYNFIYIFFLFKVSSEFKTLLINAE